MTDLDNIEQSLLEGFRYAAQAEQRLDIVELSTADLSRLIERVNGEISARQHMLKALESRLQREFGPERQTGIDAIKARMAAYRAETYAFHRLAEIFPLIEGADFEALVSDIRANGLHEPIILFEDAILDGRNRYRACLKANVEPIFKDFEGDDPLAFVLSLNLRRRHLNDSQRAMIAAKIANVRQE